MTLVEACEPLFQYVCRLSRSARKGVSTNPEAVRAEVMGVLTECKLRAAGAGLSVPYEKAEIILLYFVDSMIRTGRLWFAQTWKDLAHERNKMAGDEDFFDQLDEALKDPSEGATQRLGVFYTCLGLGFTGWYAGQPEFLRKKMLEISARLAGQIDAGRTSRICPEAYEHVNTTDLVQPPGQKIGALVVALAVLAATVFAANAVLYIDKRSRVESALKAVAPAPAHAKEGAR
jgi:type IV/VI secretion system ImpK/VasF family protein